MKQLNEEKWIRCAELIEQAASINEKTNYHVDVDLHGLYNEFEFRIYESKEPSARYLLVETIDCTGDLQPLDEEKFETVETQFDDIIKSHRNEQN